MKDHSVLMVGEETNASSLHSHSEHHLCNTFSASVSLRQKSAPPTTSGGSSGRHDPTRNVYNVLIAYRDVICTKGIPTNHNSKVYASNSDISMFQQEWERTTVYPRSRPSTTSTVRSDTNCLSRETSQSSVRNRCSQRSRNSRIRHHQQESVSDVEEDEVGETLFNKDTKNTLAVVVELQSTSSQDEECTGWKWDNSKTKLWNEDTQRKHGSII